MRTMRKVIISAGLVFFFLFCAGGSWWFMGVHQCVAQTPVTLEAEFSGTPTSGEPPLTVNFSDLSTGSPVRWEWDFNNDGVTDSTIQNPSFIYNEEGRYSVKLTIYDAAGEGSVELKTDYISAAAPTTSESLIQIKKLESNAGDYPTHPNVPITFTTQALSSGTQPLYYKYWIIPEYCSPNYDTRWEMRDYSTDNTFTWTPTEEGNYVVAVYVTDILEDVCPSVARVSIAVFLQGNLQLTVVDATNADPIQGATVEIGGQTPTTGQDGTVSITGLASGTYEMAVRHSSYITAQQEVSIVGEATTTLTVALSPGLAQGQMRIVLTWGESPRDLDSHLTGPDASGAEFHVYYGNRNPAGADANLDVDDVTSYGPETVTITDLHPGTYEYHVLDYSNGAGSNPDGNANPTSTALGLSGGRVEVYSGTARLGGFEVPHGFGTNWHVFNIDGATGQITGVNSLSGGTGPSAAGDPDLFCDNNPGYCLGVVTGPDDDCKGLAWDGSYMWVCEAGHAFSIIFKVDVSTGEAVDYFFTPGTDAQGLAFDGSYLWCLDQTDHCIYKIDRTTKTVVGVISTPSGDPYDLFTGLAWDGQDFWVAGHRKTLNPETSLYETSNYALYRVDGTTGQVLQVIGDQLTADHGVPLGLAYDGTGLWISTYNSQSIWHLDLRTGLLAETGKPSPDRGTYGMTWDGLNLWVGSWYTRGILKLDPRFIPLFTEEGSLRVTIKQIITNVSVLPLPVNSTVTITTMATGEIPNLYYKYYVGPGYCTEDFGTWEEMQQGYTTRNMVEWTPTEENDYVIRVFVSATPSGQCQALGDIAVVVGNGGPGNEEAGTPGGSN